MGHTRRSFEHVSTTRPRQTVRRSRRRARQRWTDTEPSGATLEPRPATNARRATRCDASTPLQARRRATPRPRVLMPCHRTQRTHLPLKSDCSLATHHTYALIIMRRASLSHAASYSTPLGAACVVLSHRVVRLRHVDILLQAHGPTLEILLPRAAHVAPREATRVTLQQQRMVQHGLTGQGRTRVARTSEKIGACRGPRACGW